MEAVIPYNIISRDDTEVYLFFKKRLSRKTPQGVVVEEGHHLGTVEVESYYL